MEEDKPWGVAGPKDLRAEMQLYIGKPKASLKSPEAGAANGLCAGLPPICTDFRPEVPSSSRDVPISSPEVPSCVTQITTSLSEVAILLSQVPSSVTEVTTWLSQLTISVAPLTTLLSQVPSSITEVPISFSEVPTWLN